MSVLGLVMMSWRWVRGTLALVAVLVLGFHVVFFLLAAVAHGLSMVVVLDVLLVGTLVVGVLALMMLVARGRVVRRPEGAVGGCCCCCLLDGVSEEK